MKKAIIILSLITLASAMMAQTVSKRVYQNGAPVYQNGSFVYELVSTTPPLAPTVNELMGRGFTAGDITTNNGSGDLLWSASVFDDLQAAGVDNVRIVFWYFSDSGSAPWTITPSTLTGLAAIVDELNAHGMIAIIDYHQPMMKRDGLYTTANKERWVSHWGQVANYFSATHDSTQVVYELLNEPEFKSGLSEMTVSDWNTLQQQAITAIRTYDTEKSIMITPHGWSKLEYLDNMTVPTDPSNRMILSLHHYEPKWRHVMSNWPNIRPFWSNLDYYFQRLDAWQAANPGIPVTIGEWGNKATATSPGRENYARMLANYYAYKGYSSSWWDLKAWEFEVYDDITGWMPDMRDAILTDVLPAFEAYDSLTLYQSNFTADTDGWSTYVYDGGAVSLSVSGGSLVANVTNGGTSSTNNVQLLAPAHTATLGKMYRVSYTIRGTKSFCADHLNTNHNWWNIDDLASGGTFSRTYTYEHAYTTIASNRIRFYVGGSTGLFYIDSLKIEEITYPATPPDGISILYEEDFDDFSATTTHAATTPTGITRTALETNLTNYRALGSDDAENPDLADNADIVVFDGSNALKSWYLEGQCCTSGASDWPGSLGGTGIDLYAWINSDHHGEYKACLTWNEWWDPLFQNSDGLKRLGFLMDVTWPQTASRIMLTDYSTNNLALTYYTTAYWDGFDQPQVYLSNARDLETATGEWINWTMEITIGSEAGSNGVVKIWKNGIYVGYTRTAVPFRKAGDPMWQVLNISTFMGGDNPLLYASPRDQWGMTDDIVIFTSDTPLPDDITGTLPTITDFPR